MQHTRSSIGIERIGAIAVTALAATLFMGANALADEGFPYVVPPLHLVAGPNGPSVRAPVKAPEPPADRSASCDAACLNGIAAHYLDAFGKRDYSGLPVAGNLFVTENGHATRLGNNTWRVLEKLNLPATYFADPVTGQVVALTTIEESAKQPLIYIVRLKVEERKIAEVEQIVIQDIDSGQHFRPDNVANFDPALMAPLPEDQRLKRTELLALNNAYWYGNGKLADGAKISAEGCIHWENADRLAIFNCSTGRSPESESSFTSRNLRPLLVDPARGLVITFGFEDMTPYLNPDPPDAERTPIFYRQPRTNVVMQILKFRQGNVMTAQHIFMDFQEAGLQAFFPREAAAPMGPPPGNQAGPPPAAR